MPGDPAYENYWARKKLRIMRRLQLAGYRGEYHKPGGSPSFPSMA